MDAAGAGWGNSPAGSPNVWPLWPERRPVWRRSGEVGDQPRDQPESGHSGCTHDPRLFKRSFKRAGVPFPRFRDGLILSLSRGRCRYLDALSVAFFHPGHSWPSDAILDGHQCSI